MKGDRTMQKNDKRISYPNPLKRREMYCNLNKGWEFSVDRESWQTIKVPFCPQSKLSGIGYTDFIRQCFYRKTFDYIKSEERVHLHFGAVDYRAIVYLNGNYVGSHTGGYTPFFFDITRWLHEGENEIALIVFDENENMAFGKQSFKKNSFGCFYTRITGIWQDVWLEYVPEQYVKEFYFYPNIEECSVEVELLTSHRGSYGIQVYYDKEMVGSTEGDIEYKTRVTIPLNKRKMWDLGQGNLYDVEIRFENDIVWSYFGLRKVEYQGEKFMLNGRGVFQKMVMDQGYHPEGLYTAPSVETMMLDIERGLRLGFNGARLHQKVFEPRFLYLCDKIGYMVWGEYPSWGIDYSNLEGLGQFLAEWQETLKRDFNHPSIIHWCPLNEVWGDWKDPKKKPDIRFIDTVYEFTKKFDKTRPCVDVSGGFHGKHTDLYDFHCYEPLDKIKEYLERLDMQGILEVPLLSSEGISTEYCIGQPVQLSEYGGISLQDTQTKNNTVCTVNEGAVESEEAWGYGNGETDADVFVKRYCELTEELLSHKKLSGYCYTQLYDVEQEVNGFYNYDRSDKLTELQKNQIRDCQLGQR